MGHIKLRWRCRLWYKVHYYAVTHVKYVLTYCQLICLYLQCRPITGQLHKFHRPGWFLRLKVAAGTETCTGKSVDLTSSGLRGSECVPPPGSTLIAISLFSPNLFQISIPLLDYWNAVIQLHTCCLCLFFKDVIEVGGRKNWMGMFLTKCSLLENTNWLKLENFHGNASVFIKLSS